MTEKDFDAIEDPVEAEAELSLDASVASRSLSGARQALQPSDLSVEVALLLEVRGHSGRGSVRLEQLVKAVELDPVVVHRALLDALVTVEGFRRLRHDVGISDLAYY